MKSPAAFTVVLAAASVAAAFLHNAPGCVPDETATIFSESVFPVVLQAPPVTGQIANLTLTAYTCPSRETSAAARLGTGKRRQNAKPIDVCGIMDSSAVFASAFDCTQSQGTLPTLKDCTDFATLVIDSASAV
ncbi:hypothetical protein C8R46DRAFT_1025159 [Mycena filopes]|nr:hypothetical protein C8R46DRAFT_1025159 [Mycena filopes]